MTTAMLTFILSSVSLPVLIIGMPLILSLLWLAHPICICAPPSGNVLFGVFFGHRPMTFAGASESTHEFSWLAATLASGRFRGSQLFLALQICAPIFSTSLPGKLHCGN